MTQASDLQDKNQYFPCGCKWLQPSSNILSQTSFPGKPQRNSNCRILACRACKRAPQGDIGSKNHSQNSEMERASRGTTPERLGRLPRDLASALACPPSTDRKPLPLAACMNGFGPARAASSLTLNAAAPGRVQTSPSQYGQAGKHGVPLIGPEPRSRWQANPASLRRAGQTPRKKAAFPRRLFIHGQRAWNQQNLPKFQLTARCSPESCRSSPAIPPGRYCGQTCHRNPPPPSPACP